MQDTCRALPTSSPLLSIHLAHLARHCRTCQFCLHSLSAGGGAGVRAASSLPPSANGRRQGRDHRRDLRRRQLDAGRGSGGCLPLAWHRKWLGGRHWGGGESGRALVKAGQGVALTFCSRPLTFSFTQPATWRAAHLNHAHHIPTHSHSTHQKKSCGVGAQHKQGGEKIAAGGAEGGSQSASAHRKKSVKQKKGMGGAAHALIIHGE